MLLDGGALIAAITQLPSESSVTPTTTDATTATTDDEADIDVDGEINDDDDDNDIRNSNRIIFDHIPHPSEDVRRHTTIDATFEDDDISRDDTLSMTNSRSYQQQ